MSGIYLPNVNLPESCDNCPHPTCKLWQSVNGGERHEKCPIVPVPDHGDLIDRNETVKTLAHDYAYAAADMVWNEMPTIIPADKEGET